ncbi:MAG: SH3 domain-containing protein [Candidatus Onthomonas sp.]
MKKCPVCGVEHSDIVPVCSICGSSLANAEVLPDSKAPAVTGPAEAPVPVETQAPKAETPAPESVPSFSVEDIQAAVSSVVSLAVEHDKNAPNEPAEIDPFDDDSPFVENAIRERKTAKAESPKAAAGKPAGEPKQESAAKGTAVRRPAPKKPAAAKRPEQPKPERQPKPAEPVIDTTAVAAASAQKVQAAKDNAVAARQRNAQAEGENSKSFDWSERKHKRNQPKSTTPVIAAVCALLALLIIAMVFLLGKMVTGDGNQPQDSTQPGVADGENPGGEDQQDQDVPGDGAQPDQQEPEDTALLENDPNAEDQGDDADPDAAALENQDEQDGQQSQEGEDSQQPENGDSSSVEKPAEKPALPEITEVNDTVYATAAVNVRDYPSTDNGTVINVLSKGQAVTRTGKTATGWSRVKIGDAVGYVSNSYLSATKVDSAAESDSKEENMAYATAGVNVRETPNGTVIGTLTQGQKVTLTGKKDGNWIQIQTGSLTGYVYSSYLSSDQGSGSTQADNSKQDDVKVTETNDTVYATTGVNVRDYPSSSTGKVVATLTQGQKVTRIGKTSNGWSKIQVGSVTGYVYSDYLSTSKDGGSGSSGDSGSSGKNTGYILPESNTRNYTKDELSALSSSQLRLARNEIYARHGRKFNDKSLQDYFNGCSWYKGTVDPATFDANIYSYLNSYEIANLELIKEVEG